MRWQAVLGIAGVAVLNVGALFGVVVLAMAGIALFAPAAGLAFYNLATS